MNQIPLWVYFAVLPSIIAIGVLDYVVFNRWNKCDKCGHQNTLWYYWILPTLVEAFLFFLGILIGFKIGV